MKPKAVRKAADQSKEADPALNVIELTVVAEPGTEPPPPQSDIEKRDLAECEQIIEQGLVTFFEVGHALLKIRENRLYRPAYSSFKQYCQTRWNIGPSYAWRVIGAAERLKLLRDEDDVPRPENEFQMRPFLKLAPDQFPGAWSRVVKTAKGKVTSKIVRAVIRELLPKKKRRQKKVKMKLPAGQIFVLVNEARRQMVRGETEKALAALERIETFLFKA